VRGANLLAGRVSYDFNENLRMGTIFTNGDPICRHQGDALTRIEGNSLTAAEAGTAIRTLSAIKSPL